MGLLHRLLAMDVVDAEGLDDGALPFTFLVASSRASAVSTT